MPGLQGPVSYDHDWSRSTHLRVSVGLTHSGQEPSAPGHSPSSSSSGSESRLAMMRHTPPIARTAAAVNNGSTKAPYRFVRKTNSRATMASSQIPARAITTSGTPAATSANIAFPLLIAGLPRRWCSAPPRLHSPGVSEQELSLPSGLDHNRHSPKQRV